MSWGQVAAALLLSYAGYKLATSGTKKKAISGTSAGGLSTAADCSKWQITDEAQTKATSERIYEEFIAKGNPDPWDIADEIVRQIAPNCHTSEQGMRSLAEIDLYRQVFIETINRELWTNRIDQQLYEIYKTELEAFLLEQGQ